MHGGARAGAGRKKSGRHTVNFWVSDSEEVALRNLLNELRSEMIISETVSTEADRKPDVAVTVVEGTCKEEHPENVSLEAKLESMGQTSILDYLGKEKSDDSSNATVAQETVEQGIVIDKPSKKTKRGKSGSRELADEAMLSWKIELNSKIVKLRKVSKRKAANLLAEELYIALNAVIDNPKNKIAKQKIDYAQKYIKDVVDARSITEEWSDMIVGFMHYCDYYFARDIDFVKRWMKLPKI